MHDNATQDNMIGLMKKKNNNFEHYLGFIL